MNPNEKNKNNKEKEEGEIIREFGSDGVYREYKEWNRNNKTLEDFNENEDCEKI